MTICDKYIHELILIGLIICIGGFAGYINYLKSVSKSTEDIKARHYVLSGMGAAILVPLFLNMLSSNLIRYVGDYDHNNYFVFAGFCFIAGYFSDKFIDSIGDKLLKELKETKDKVESTSVKLEKTSQVLKDNKEKVDALIENESELNDDGLNSTIQLSDLNLQTNHIDDDIPDKMNRIIDTFKGDYKFRTVEGIAKELSYPTLIVDMILNGLERHGAVKKFGTANGNMLWSLTKIGQLVNKKQED